MGRLGTKDETGALGPVLRLRRRDRELIAALAVARYLTQDQLTRLFFAHLKDPMDANRRLLQLGGVTVRGRKTKVFDPPYLRRLRCRGREGGELTCWELTRAGHGLAETILGRSSSSTAGGDGDGSVEQATVINELFVGLALPSLRAGGRVGRLAFRWSAAGSVRLPGRRPELVPAAVLEVPSAQRRFFLEWEGDSSWSEGSSLKKLARYEEGLSGLAEPRLQPERAPEVIYLVRTPSRRDWLNAIIARWRGGRAGTWVAARALTLSEALETIASVLPASPPPSGGASAEVRLSAEELEVLHGFYQHAVRTVAAPRSKQEGSFRAWAARAGEVFARLGKQQSR